MSFAARAWTVVALLWVVGLLNYVDRQVIFSVLPLVARDFQASSVQLGLLSTVFLAVYGVLSPVAGYFADRFGRRRMILISLLVWSAVTWATGHARTFTELLWARALMGASEACYIPAALAMIADWHTARSRALATGLHTSGIYVGIILGGYGGGWMGERYGWRFAFTLLGVAGIAYSLLLTWLLPSARPTETPQAEAAPRVRLGASLAELVRTPAFIVMTLVFCGFGTANWIVYTWLPLYIYEKFHVGLAEAGFTATFYIQAGSFAGILLGGRLSDSWVQRTPRGRVLTQAIGMGAAAPFLFLAGGAGWWWAVIAGLAVFGLGRGMYDANAMPALCQIARPELRATGYGIFNMGGCIVGGAMAAVAGALKDRFGLGAMFQAAGLLLLVCSILLVRLRPRAEKAVL